MRRDRPSIWPRDQILPSAAERARSASGPSGLTKRARAFRQRSSRPRVRPSRTLSGDTTQRIVTSSEVFRGPLAVRWRVSGATPGPLAFDLGPEGKSLLPLALLGMKLLFLTELLQIFRPLPGRHLLLSLHGNPDLLHHVGIGQGGDVAGVEGIGDGGQDTSHDLPGAGLGHVRNDVHSLRTGDLADHSLDRRDYLVGDHLARSVARLQRNVDLGNAALDFID